MAWRSLLLVLLVSGCTREPIALARDAGSRRDTIDPFAPCTDPARCCPAEELICHEGGEHLICTCLSLWDCTPGPGHCRQEAPAPPGGGEWSCTWTELSYSCTRVVPSGEPGPSPATLPHGKRWSCAWQEATRRWTCAREPPNPSNLPEGVAVWRCAVEAGLLVCTRGTPSADSGA